MLAQRGSKKGFLSVKVPVAYPAFFVADMGALRISIFKKFKIYQKGYPFHTIKLSVQQFRSTPLPSSGCNARSITFVFSHMRVRVRLVGKRSGSSGWVWAWP